MAWISYLWVERVETKTNENTNLTAQGNTPPVSSEKVGTLGISPSNRGFRWWFTYTDIHGHEITMSGPVDDYVTPKELLEFIKNKPADKQVKFTGIEYFPDESPYARFEY